MQTNPIVDRLYHFDNQKEFTDVYTKLSTICPLLFQKAIGKVLSNSPATVKYGSIKGKSKAAYIKNKNSSRIILDKTKLGNQKTLVLRNIILESCNITYHDKRPEVFDKIKQAYATHSSLTKEDMQLLRIGRVKKMDVDELNSRIETITKANLTTEESLKEIKKLAYETTEYYSMKYFDSICSFLEQSGVHIPKKEFESLHQYLAIQESTGHSDLYS